MQITRSGKGWRARVRVNGRDQSKSFRTQAEAKAWAVKAESDALSTIPGSAPKGSTVADLFERYLVEVTPKKRSSITEEARLTKMLGRGRDGTADPLVEVPLEKLCSTDFSEWRDRRLKVVSVGSVLREWNTLSAIMTWAVKELRWIAANPLKDVKRPSSPDPRTRRISEAEIERICHAAGYDEQVPLNTATLRTVAAFLFAIETAMRAGEIVKLTWGNVDLEKRTAFLPMTKNGSPRTVPLSLAAIALIERLRGIHEERVFDIRSSILEALFRKLIKRALVEDLHFHDTRREALSRLSKKVDVLQLARISGHKDLKILLGTYYQVDMADVALLLN